MKKRKAKTGGVPRLSGRAVDGNEYQIPINLTEAWTWPDGRRDGGKEDRGGESVSLAPRSVHDTDHVRRARTPASDSFSDGLKIGAQVM